MRFFARKTKGSGYNAIVMGKNTWSILPRQPLPGRVNCVLSRSTLEVPDSVLGGERRFFNSTESVKAYCADKFEELWIIGDGEIYEQFMDDPSVDAIYLTNIPGEYECDTFFPEIPSSFTEREKIYLSETLSVSVFVKR